LSRFPPYAPTSEPKILLPDPYFNHEIGWYIQNPESETLYLHIPDAPAPPYGEMIIYKYPLIGLSIS
jgi:hypothetical protein